MTQCPNCGYQMGQHESNCKYCGTNNPSFKKESKPNYNFTFPSSNEAQSNNNFSWGIFILLLIVFWPVAIIYLIINNVKKS
ncbi:MAG: hypothetical protein M0Q00_04220 [Acholeplasmataceae bacterium]|jgi:uncharacterized membrane protein YvbJ|nr:hypothetical protein [Acholeplasmataceae bacterium]